MEDAGLELMALALKKAVAARLADVGTGVWHDIPADVRKECRGWMTLMTRMTLAMTCRDERAQLAAALPDEAWMAEGYGALCALSNNDDLVIHRYRTVDKAGFLTRAMYAQRMPVIRGSWGPTIQVFLPIRHKSDDCPPVCKCKSRGSCYIEAVSTSMTWWRLMFTHPDLRSGWSPGKLYSNPARLLPIAALVRQSCLWPEIKTKELNECAKELIDEK